MTTFVAGLRLCAAFHCEVVRPLLTKGFPSLRYAAARVGRGSDVLGFDTPRSTDHDWGPRLDLFISAGDLQRYGEQISDMLAERLPKSFHGWSTHFEPPDGRVRVMAPTDGPVAHGVVVTDVATWSRKQLGFDAARGVTTIDWLAAPAQRLAEVTGGEVFYDDVGDLTRLREQLTWYPDDVWRYLLACQWLRISEEEPFVGRTAEADDELGSRIVSARLARDVMRLCLLMARRYPTYGKWLGAAFANTSGTKRIAAALTSALAAEQDSEGRQAALCDAYEAAGAWQNSLRLAEPVDPRRRLFFDRPYSIVDAARYATALFARIDDPYLASMPSVGSIDQFVDSTAVLTNPALTGSLMAAVRETTSPVSEQPLS
jgi:hypothetical protein